MIDTTDMASVFFSQDTDEARLALDRLAFHLVLLILHDHPLPDVQSLRRFCANAENLRDWLPDPADRATCSARIAQRIYPLCAA